MAVDAAQQKVGLGDEKGKPVRDRIVGPHEGNFATNDAIRLLWQARTELGDWSYEMRSRQGEAVGC
jgi:hypothetical protein